MRNQTRSTWSHSRGFTLVELISAMTASMILIMGFGSVIVFSRSQLTQTNVRVGLGYDQVLIDRYVRTKLTTTVSDSMQIFVDAAAEASSTTSTTGSILRSVDADSTVYHLGITGGSLQWMIDSTTHTPVDCEVSELVFTERNGNHSKLLNLSMNLSSAGDTLACEWSITLRN
ncbi:MAG: prepilin-type N-terminal cleavage/methylation domain-containing protein [Candidatus Marinimicrobia bacterium]|nr:prepilin-type N-terminal cleavage/methylation domain-containing protein [Candidatus Neomarinimicrobiota bacterium]